MSNTSKTKTAVKTRVKRVKTESDVVVTETKFTPTPWRIDDYGYGYKIEPNICWIGETTSVPPEQLRANADLIVAAPRMLAALEKIMETELAIAQEHRVQAEDSEIYCIAEEVVRQARGESEAQK